MLQVDYTLKTRICLKDNNFICSSFAIKESAEALSWGCVRFCGFVLFAVVVVGYGVLAGVGVPT